MSNDLAPTVASLGDDFRSICERLHRERWRAVQLSAAMIGMRPQDLGASARRDVVATLRRLELVAGGMDLWIPPEHFLDPTQVDRAASAVDAACRLARDLSISTLSLHLPQPSQLESAVLESILASAARSGVVLADHPAPGSESVIPTQGLDPAARLAADEDPVEAVLSLGGALVAPRLSDLLSTGFRGPLGQADGRLELPAYRAAVATVSGGMPVVLDVRQLERPWTAIRAGRAAWEAAAII